MTVAMVPKLGDDHAYSDAERADRNCEILHESLRAVCHGISDLQRRGVMLRWGDGVIRKTVPVIALYNADIVERTKILMLERTKILVNIMTIIFYSVKICYL